MGMGFDDMNEHHPHPGLARRAEKSPAMYCAVGHRFRRRARPAARYGLELARVADGEPIPGSYLGECEAGLVGNVVHARADTLVHSLLLHEAAPDRAPCLNAALRYIPTPPD